MVDRVLSGPVSRFREGSRAGMLPFPAALSWMDANKSNLPRDPTSARPAKDLLKLSNFLLTIFDFPIVGCMVHLKK